MAAEGRDHRIGIGGGIVAKGVEEADQRIGITGRGSVIRPEAKALVCQILPREQLPGVLLAGGGKIAVGDDVVGGDGVALGDVLKQFQ